VRYTHPGPYGRWGQFFYIFFEQIDDQEVLGIRTQTLYRSLEAAAFVLGRKVDIGATRIINHRRAHGSALSDWAQWDEATTPGRAHEDSRHVRTWDGAHAYSKGAVSCAWRRGARVW
jgi:hypothetical protein